MKLNSPIINDKIRFDKKKYWDYVNKGGDKKEYKKKSVIEKGENKINGKFSLKEGKFNRFNHIKYSYRCEYQSQIYK